MKYKLTFILVSIISLFIFLFISWPGGSYFQNDEFGHLPLIMKNNLIINSMPRPLATFTVYMDYQLWGDNPFGYHLTNLIIQLANCILIYRLSFLLWANEGSNPPTKKIKSLSVAILFLFYSFHSESLYWISGRSGSLGGFFVLLTLLFYLKRHQSFYYLLFSLLAFTGGLLSYETSWVCLFAIPLISFFHFSPRKADIKKELLFSFLFFLCFLGYILWRINTVGHIAPNYATGNIKTGSLMMLLKNFNQLLARSFLPPMQSGTLFVSCYIGIILLAVAFFLRIYFKKQHLSKTALLCLILFVLSLLPAISLGISIHNSEGERFIYVASIFLIIALIELLHFLFKKTDHKFWIVFGAFTVIHTWLLFRNSVDYRNGQMMAKGIINCAKNYKVNVQELYVINLPLQLKGVIMFRNGFVPALKWLAPDLRFEKFNNIQPVMLEKYYKIKCKEAGYNEMKGELDKFDIPFVPQKTMIIWCTSDCIYFITDSSLLKP